MQRLVVVSLFVIALGLGAAARAGTLVSATWTQTLEGVAISVTNSGATCADTDPTHVPGYTSITCPTAGLQATGSSAGTAYNVGLTMPLFEMQAFTTGGVINVGTMAILEGAQVITGDGVYATATQGVQGTVLVGGAMINMLGMWSQPPGGTLLQIPLSVGKAGLFTDTFTVLGSYHFVTVDFYAWTLGTLAFTGLTSAGAALPDVVAMGTFDLDANGAGTVTLVSPSKVSIDGPAAQRRTASFATLKLTFVPEPGACLLLGAGVLALLRYRRQR